MYLNVAALFRPAACSNYIKTRTLRASRCFYCCLRWCLLDSEWKMRQELKSKTAAKAKNKCPVLTVGRWVFGVLDPVKESSNGLAIYKRLSVPNTKWSAQRRSAVCLHFTKKTSSFAGLNMCPLLVACAGSSQDSTSNIWKEMLSSRVTIEGTQGGVNQSW